MLGIKAPHILLYIKPSPKSGDPNRSSIVGHTDRIVMSSFAGLDKVSLQVELWDYRCV
jgi:hypothetical protein